MGLLSAAMAVPVLGYLFVPKQGSKRASWIDAGPLAGLEPGKPKEIFFERTRRDGWKVKTERASTILVQQPGGEVQAFSTMCTHLGCGVRANTGGEGFVCPCHDSYFNVDGTVLSGPAPRPLDQYETRVEGGRLWLGPIRPGGEAA